MLYSFVFLKGNPWNCTRDLKWLLIHSRSKHVSDREALLCVDSQYSTRPVLSVMHYKLVKSDGAICLILYVFRSNERNFLFS